MTDSLQRSSPVSEVLTLIDKRLADLREANDIFRGVDWDRSSDIQRNDREIRWLIDFRTVLLTGGHAQTPAVPDDYIVLPRKLTAENGAKAALIGEFCETTTVMDENGDERPFKVPVSWDTIKRIWDAAVLHFAVSDTSTVQPQPDWNYTPKPGQLSGPSTKD